MTSEDRNALAAKDAEVYAAAEVLAAKVRARNEFARRLTKRHVHAIRDQ